MAPSISALVDAGYIEAISVPQLSTFEAAILVSRCEGIVPAPESAHAIRAAMDEALDAKEKGEERVILFNLSGHGNFDMGSYQAYLAGQLQDFDYPQEKIEAAKETLPQVRVQV
ncbi:MAG TPA: TrpB-like pyridoxal-phosphate dependent enzyme, partial [Anaerolineales bacterium]|nr:TrpB-like pyridoxal-phosphate dependent enzyme [Anaerolineales bacterium]